MEDLLLIVTHRGSPTDEADLTGQPSPFPKRSMHHYGTISISTPGCLSAAVFGVCRSARRQFGGQKVEGSTKTQSYTPRRESRGGSTIAAIACGLLREMNGPSSTSMSGRLSCFYRDGRDTSTSMKKMICWAQRPQVPNNTASQRSHRVNPNATASIVSHPYRSPARKVARFRHLISVQM